MKEYKRLFQEGKSTTPKYIINAKENGKKLLG